jgi:cell division protein FtsQ
MAQSSYLALLVGGGALILAIWLSYGLVASEKFPIRWVQVDGPFRYVSAAQIRATVVPYAEAGYFAVDLDAIQTALEQQAWVSKVLVRKQWPDLIDVVVEEHRPVARWAAGGLIDSYGEHFEVPDGLGPEQLPLLDGPDDRRQEVVNTWLKMRDVLAPTGMDVREISMQRRGAWQLLTDSGMKVALGREDIEARLKRFVNIYVSLRQRAQLAQIERVDLRYPNGVAVRWREQRAAAGALEDNLRSQR